MTSAQRILAPARRRPLVRPRDVEARGIARESLLRLYRQGLLVRQARGVYALPESPVTEHHSLAIASKRTPGGVICLLSALKFHDLTTQDPHEVWMAIDFEALEGVRVPIYSAAKTVADCFQYRNKLGVDIAIEAPRDALRSRRATVDQIHPFAKVCRVANVIRPYLESAV